MLYRVEAPGQSARFATQFAGPLGQTRPVATLTARRRAVGTIDSGTYQAMLANLGLTPDPRLCVPAARQ